MSVRPFARMFDLSVRLASCLYVFSPSVHPALRPSVCLSVILSACPSVYLTLFLSVHLAICPSDCLSAIRPLARLSVRP